MIILDLFSAVARYPKHSKIKRFMQNKLDIAFQMRYTARMVLPSRAIPVRKEAGRSCCALKLNTKQIEKQQK